MTHIFNAMRPFAAREPGLAGAALVSRDVVVQVILDGVHLADDTARLVWQAAGGQGRARHRRDRGRRCGGRQLHACGRGLRGRERRRAKRRSGAGREHRLHDRRRSQSRRARRAASQRRLGAASEVPARIAGRPELGTLDPGSTADIVVLDDRLEIVRVLVAGLDVRARPIGRASLSPGDASTDSGRRGTARRRSSG